MYLAGKTVVQKQGEGPTVHNNIKPNFYLRHGMASECMEWGTQVLLWYFLGPKNPGLFVEGKYSKGSQFLHPVNGACQSN